MNGHGGYGEWAGKDGHCWWLSINEFESYKDEKIVIYREGNKVIAKNLATKKTTEAKCHADDTFDFKIGAKLALERLYQPELLHKFEEGKCYVFDLDAYKKDCNYRGDKCYHWADNCHGQNVKVTTSTSGRVNGIDGKTYSISSNWCKEVEKPKYYNGKVVCVGNTNNTNSLTVGKIYEYVDGFLTDDKGNKRPYIGGPITKLEDLNWSAKVIEVIE